MRLATWNVNGLRARLEFVLDWLRTRRPDVVGLQETKVPDDQFPWREVEALGYRAAVHGQGGWNGVAILSRRPLLVTQIGLPGQADLGARFLAARIGDLRFATAYVPNGKSVDHEDFPRKLAWLDALADHLERSFDPAGDLVLCGDFNVCPTGLDSWDEAGFAGSIHHTGLERERFGRLGAWGLTDLVRHTAPAARVFSWWDYRGGAFHRGQGLRIDFVLATASLLGRVRSAEIDRDYRKKKLGRIPSDHAPVIVDLLDEPGAEAAQ